jgi:elongation factor P hydroxylase
MNQTSLEKLLDRVKSKGPKFYAMSADDLREQFGEDGIKLRSAVFSCYMNCLKNGMKEKAESIAEKYGLNSYVFHKI